MYDAYSHIVYAASGSDVETVIVHGRVVMKNRRLLTINEDEAMKEVRKIAKRIQSVGNFISGQGRLQSPTITYDLSKTP